MVGIGKAFAEDRAQVECRGGLEFSEGCAIVVPMESGVFVIALKRRARAEAPGNWKDMVAAVSGVDVLGVSGNRVQIRATRAALEQLRTRLGRVCHIEPVVLHHAS